MFKRIPVTADDSPTSALALQEAMRLAKEQQAQLRIAHVVDEDTLNRPEAGDVGEVQETFRKSGHKILEKAAATVRAAGVTAETRMLEIETFGYRVADMNATEAEAWRASLPSRCC
ncbi:MAG: universal stress protein [Gammaproteobacteria bacterium]|nr:universal stress protein [Gammaproteobacteria bacterium]